MIGKFVTGSPYRNNKALRKRFICDAPWSVALKFDLFETELSFDYVTVFDVVRGQEILRKF